MRKLKILITGAGGFIGSALCSQLSTDNKIIGVDITGPADVALNIAWEQADLTDLDSAAAICEKYSPDVVIHCAGIAHQKIGTVDSATYMRINSEATEKLAETAAKCNSDVCFVFFSSVSVYGENPQITQISQNKKDTSRPSTICRTYGVNKGTKVLKKENDDGLGEDGECRPSSDYAVSKLDAERRLVALFDEGKLHNLIILRLAPVYDREWSLNLDRRVFAPKKLAYLRFGSGSQKMSALARPNLIDFIDFLINSKLAASVRSSGLTPVPYARATPVPSSGATGQADTHRHTGRKKDENTGLNILNVCDAEPYEFNRIIQVFKNSGIHSNKPVISVPLSFVWLATRIAGVFFSNKREWIHSCYDKLASDLVFDNGKMMGTGFKPINTLENIFLS